MNNLFLYGRSKFRIRKPTDKFVPKFFGRQQCNRIRLNRIHSRVRRIVNTTVQNICNLIYDRCPFSIQGEIAVGHCRENIFFCQKLVAIPAIKLIVIFCRSHRRQQYRSVFLRNRCNFASTVRIKRYRANIIPFSIQSQIPDSALNLIYFFRACTIYKPTAKCIPYFCRRLQFYAVLNRIRYGVCLIVFAVIQDICDRINFFIPFCVEMQIPYTALFHRSANRICKFFITIPPYKLISPLRR